jgi:hypothetical protein
VNASDSSSATSIDGDSVTESDVVPSAAPAGRSRSKTASSASRPLAPSIRRSPYGTTGSAATAASLSCDVSASTRTCASPCASPVSTSSNGFTPPGGRRSLRSNSPVARSRSGAKRTTTSASVSRPEWTVPVAVVVSPCVRKRGASGRTMMRLTVRNPVRPSPTSGPADAPRAVTRHSVRLSGRSTSSVAVPSSPVRTEGFENAVSAKR